MKLRRVLEVLSEGLVGSVWTVLRWRERCGQCVVGSGIPRYQLVLCRLLMGWQPVGVERLDAKLESREESCVRGESP